MLDTATEVLRPLVTSWLKNINLAIEHRKPWENSAEQCMNFFSGSLGFLWEDQFQRKFLKAPIQSKFRITINKAFEVVALFGPVLYARNPVRALKGYPPVEFGPEILGDPNDPNVQMAFQQMMMQEQMRQARIKLRIDLGDRVMNYTPREQPDGGLEQAAEDAITETLVKGMGCLWPQVYSMPGSQRKLTGSFYDSADNLVIDPDATSFSFGDARWIARKRVRATWEVERDFRLPAGSLTRKGKMESAAAQAARASQKLGNSQRAKGLSFDLMTYWEIYSLGGVGTRLTGTDKTLQDAFDEVVGDYAYLCVAEDVPWPLNCHKDNLLRGTTEEVKRALSWPIPYWLDRRWPLARLDFYRKPNSPYPIPPLEPGMGELVFLNVMISALCNRIHSSSRDFIAVLESACENIEKTFKEGDHLAIIRLKQVHRNIGDVVSFLKQPEVSFDVWKIINAISEQFDKRVGLNDLLYGLNPGGTASRTASDIMAKQEKLNIRPDHMSQKVEQWMTEAARLEKLALYFGGVSGEDVRPLLGDVGAGLWDQVWTQEDPEVILRETDCTVQAGTARKPNKDRDIANLNQIAGYVLPELSKENDKGNPQPWNAFMRKLGEAMDQDLTGVFLQPGPPPEEMAQQQQQMMEEQQEMEQQQWQAEEGRKGQSHEQEMQQSQEKHKLEMKQDKEEGALKLKLQKAQARMKRLQPAGTNGRK